MRRNFLCGVFLAALAVCGTVLVTPDAMAGGSGSGGGGGGGGGNARRLSFTGKIVSIDSSAQKFTTSTTLYYNPPAVWNVSAVSSAIFINNKPATFADLKVGDTITVTVDDQSVVASKILVTR